MKPQTFDLYTRTAQDLRPLVDSSTRTQPEFQLAIWDYLARLADALGEVSAFLATLDQVSTTQPWALGPGSAGDGLQVALGNWERYRLLLGRHLDELAVGARSAGAAYVTVDASVGVAMGGPTP